jgi:hypothetical protein
MSTHVVEILRDAGPKVMLCPIINWGNLYCTGETRVGNCQAHWGSPWKNLGGYQGELNVLR